LGGRKRRKSDKRREGGEEQRCRHLYIISFLNRDGQTHVFCSEVVWGSWCIGTTVAKKWRVERIVDYLVEIPVPQ
jgi:hypothetical protein